MSRIVRLEDLYCDIAPVMGRNNLTKLEEGTSPVTWQQGGFSLGGKMMGAANPGEITVSVKGRLRPAAGHASNGWVELETSRQIDPVILDAFLVGTQPLPSSNITCICRHPSRSDLFLAATAEGDLLFLDANLPANLRIVAKAELPAPAISMVVFGTRIIALNAKPGQSLLILELDDSQLGVMPMNRIDLAVGLTALAEDDETCLWGLSEKGIIYKILIRGAGSPSSPADRLTADVMKEQCRLRRIILATAGISEMALSIYRAIKNGDYSLWKLFSGRGVFRSIAYDGRFFWVIRTTRRHRSSHMLMVYDTSGTLQRVFTTWPEASVSFLNSLHNGLLVLDHEHDRCHRYHTVDSMQPVTGGPLVSGSHPGYLPAGTSQTGGIHDLCLLYVGGEGNQRVHRYDGDKLKPLVGYISAQGGIRDAFMDGFLLLAQYSPLLNGRAFGTDLRGRPSRQEDWIALFDEYFHPHCNLQALDSCAAIVARQLQRGPAGFKLKIVLAVPTPDPRCTDWDGRGQSLDDHQYRIDAVAWAMQDLLERWTRAQFEWLELVGFYYMDEQGRIDDEVLHSFPDLCRQKGMRSFAIPGLTSAWLTEFNRAGFDGIALQSSHAFRKPMGRPHDYWLKCAGRIARDFRMGMEVELPYNVLEPAGQKILRDYLEMARIQGWAGGFKAYFQSYNLISQLASSPDPECRLLYDELYRFSHIGQAEDRGPAVLFGGVRLVDWRGYGKVEGGQKTFRLNIEGYPGDIEINQLSIIPAPSPIQS